MTHTSHTPGPWTASANDITVMPDGIHWREWDVDAENGERIAFGTSYELHDGIQAQANARLIAEAPAMLDVLKRVDCGGKEGHTEFCLLGEINAIIARIEGA